MLKRMVFENCKVTRDHVSFLDVCCSEAEKLRLEGKLPQSYEMNIFDNITAISIRS